MNVGRWGDVAAPSMQSFGSSATMHTPPGDELEPRWKEFSRDSSEWWDNRISKPRPRPPDFEHKVTKEPLWMDSSHNPLWVMEKLMSSRLATEHSCSGAVTADALSPSDIWACCKNKDLGKGTRMHNEIRRRGLAEKNYSDALVTMYAKCGELQKAQVLLDMHNSSHIIPWNALIAGYARERKGNNALLCFEQMQREGLTPSAVTYMCILKACAVIGAIDKGKQIHDEVLTQGLLSHHMALGAALVDMYAKCGSLCQAQIVLENLPSRNVFSWNALVAGYAKNGQGQQALDCLERMQGEGILPDKVTYACILKACAAIGAIDKGNQIHDEISRQGLLEHDVVLGGALVDMYAKCGALQKAQSVLEKLSYRNVVSWNALVAGYVQNGQCQQALNCLEHMHGDDILPNEVTYACILKACAAIGDIDKGKQIHDQISRQGLLEHDVVLGGALVDMYAKCGALVQAQSVLRKLSYRDVVTWNALIIGHARNGQALQALDYFEQMQRDHILPNEVTYVCVLKACAAIEALDKGKKIHGEILSRGLLEYHVVLGGALVDMYAKCGALCQAQSVLDELPFRNVISWNALITGYAQNRQGQQALDCFEQMQHDGIIPDEVTYACILKACAAIGAISKGKQIHDEISAQGLLERCVVLGNALVDMYAKCGALLQAQSVLEKLPSRDVVSWNALMTGYAQNGQGQQVLDYFEQMQREGILPDEVTYVCVLKACAEIRVVDKGKQIHDEILRQGLLEHHVVLGGALVDMYARCGDLCQAQDVLDKLPSRNVVSWNALIAGYAQNRQGEQAIDCFNQMHCDGILPNESTYVCVLKACALIGDIDNGKKIHDEILTQGLLEDDVVLGNALVDMYAKCGALLQAQSVHLKLPSHDIISWNALITGYAQNGQGQQALDCFEQMQCEGILLNEVTFICLLKACAVIGAIGKGKQIHDEILTQGLLEHNILLGNALVAMYAKCGALLQGQHVLEQLPYHDVVSWNALITGYVQYGHGQQALDCFEQMQGEGILPNAVTFICVLKACAMIGAISKGKQIHDEILSQGLLEDDVLLGNALVNMYAKCGALLQAQSVLEKLSSPDVVSWNALITGYTQNRQGQQALDCFEQMQCDGILPNEVTYACILKACAVIGNFGKGKQVHDEILTQGLLEDDVVLGNALVDMYANCGALLHAQNVLEKLPSRNVVSWNALITGYAQNGQGQQALDCFERMQRKGILPDEVTFVCLLNLCSHLGLVEKGQALFDSMDAIYGLKPNVESVTCLVDLLGRAGHLVKAVEVIQGMPFSTNSAIWHCLLGACQKCGDVNVGAWAFEQAVQLDKYDETAYVLMANIYAAAGILQKARDIEALRKDKAWKLPVCTSWTDPSKLNAFCVGDKKYDQNQEIDLKLEDIMNIMLQERYIPNLSLVSGDKFDAEKAQFLCCHSEKLALACAF